MTDREEQAYDQGFDFGLNEGREERTEQVEEHLKDFIKFCNEVNNYGNGDMKTQLLEQLCNKVSGIEDLPTIRLDIM